MDLRLVFYAGRGSSISKVRVIRPQAADLPPPLLAIGGLP
jgi:hypothetical protein